MLNSITHSTSSNFWQRPQRAIWGLALAIVLVLSISTFILLWQLRDRELHHAKLESVAIVQMLMEETDQSLMNADQMVLSIQERLSNSFGSQVSLDGPASHLLLSARAASANRVESVFLVDEKAILVNTSLESAIHPTSVRDRDYFRAFADRGEHSYFIDTPVRSKRDGHWSIHLARGLWHPNGKFRGVVVAALSIPKFEQLYSTMRLDYGRPMAMYLPNGTLVASAPHRESMIGSVAPELASMAMPKAPGQVDTHYHQTRSGTRELFVLGRLSKFPLLISVTDDEVQSLASWRETAAPILVGSMMIVFFTVLMAAILGRRVVVHQTLAKALEMANDRYFHTVGSVMDAIVAVDQSGRIVLFNAAAERLFRWPARDAVGQRLDVLIPARFRAAHQAHLDQGGFGLPDQVANRQIAAVGLRADGTEFPFESSISRSVIGGEVQLTAVLRDVSAQRSVEAELRLVNMQLRALSTTLQSVREEERTRISRELHDELGQQLTGLKLQLSWFGGRIKEGRAALVETVDEMRQLLDVSIASVRRISAELRPPILDDLGFGEAVAWHAQEVAKRSNLRIDVEIAEAAQLVSNDVCTALFRIVQESLTNVVRHANARTVTISLIASGEQGLRLTISDDGQGMAADVGRTGIGLVSMRERATSIGARFMIRPASPGTGTVIDVELETEQRAPGGRI